MAVPKVFRWDDVGAPVLTDPRDKNQWLALFQAVFVNGYNGNPGLGWVIEFEDISTGGSKIVMRQGGTNPNKLWVGWEFSTAVAGTYQGPWPTYAESYSDINTPVNLITTGSNTQAITWGLTPTPGSYTHTWMVIGTETACYIIGGANEIVAQPTIPTLFSDELGVGRYTSIHFMGSYKPQAGTASDAMRSHLFAHRPQSTYGTWAARVNEHFMMLGFPYTAHNLFYSARDFRDTYLGTNNTTITPLEHLAGYFGGITSNPPYPDPYNGGIYLKDVPIAVNGSYVGKIPGFYYSPQYLPFYDERTTNGCLKTIEGSNEHSGTTFLAIASSRGTIILDISTDWGVE